MDPKQRAAAYEFGGFRVDLQRRMLLSKADGRPLPLTSRAYDLLIFFLEHPNELLDKSTLMEAVWPTVVVEENNLNQHISALRRALGETPEERRFIVTVPGRGYRFVAPVEAAAADASAVCTTDSAVLPADFAVSSADSAVSPPDALTGQPGSGWPVIPRGFWALGVLGVLIAAGAWYAAHRSGPSVHPTVDSIEVVPVHKPRLAVLPFENLSPDPDNAFFTDGLHEEILTTLADRIPGIEVISRTTMMSYRANPPKPISLIARELRASDLIEGSVRREGDRVRLTLKLIDAATDRDIWSSSYDRTLADALALESQVAGEIAGQLATQIAPAVRADAAPMHDGEAFDLYLKAMIAFRTFTGENDPSDLHNIEDLLSRVIRREPGFAPAYAQRAIARTIWFASSRDTSDDLVSKIRADLATAQRLAPRDPNVVTATAAFLLSTNDTSAALELYSTADSGRFGSPELLVPQIFLLLRRSRVDEVDAAVQRMLSLDPVNPLVIRTAAYVFHQARQPLQALQAAAYAREAFPPLYEIMRGYVLMDFAGSTRSLHSFIDRFEPAADPAAFTNSLQDYFVVLRYEHHYAELRAYIDRAPQAAAIYYSGLDFGPVGPTPTAMFRGWVDLLLADRAGATRDGRAVLSFVQGTARTRWNAGYLELLTAVGYAFTGDCARALTTGKSALAMIARNDDALVWNQRALEVARVDAWCGATEEAVALLRGLASSRPGVGPSTITRDPLFTVPLERVPAFRDLSGQLEKTLLPADAVEPGATAVN